MAKKYIDPQKQKLSLELATKIEDLKNRIALIPANCPYREHANAVLNEIQYLSKTQEDFYEFPLELLIATAVQTEKLLDATANTIQCVKAAENYMIFTQNLKTDGVLTVLAATMFAFGAVVMMAVFPFIIYKIPVIADALGGIAGFPAIVIPSALSLILHTVSAFFSGAFFVEGARTLSLAKSLGNLMNEVNKRPKYFEMGTKALQKNELQEAYRYLSNVTEDDPNYRKAHLMIVANRLSPDSQSKTTKDNLDDIHQQVRALEGESPEIPNIKLDPNELFEPDQEAVLAF